MNWKIGWKLIRFVRLRSSSSHRGCLLLDNGQLINLHRAHHLGKMVQRFRDSIQNHSRWVIMKDMYGLGYGLGQSNEITEFAGTCIFIPCFALTMFITWIISWECFDNDHGFLDILDFCYISRLQCNKITIVNSLANLFL